MVKYDCHSQNRSWKRAVRRRSNGCGIRRTRVGEDRSEVGDKAGPSCSTPVGPQDAQEWLGPQDRPAGIQPTTGSEERLPAVSTANSTRNVDLHRSAWALQSDGSSGPDVAAGVFSICLAGLSPCCGDIRVILCNLDFFQAGNDDRLPPLD